MSGYEGWSVVGYARNRHYVIDREPICGFRPTRGGSTVIAACRACGCTELDACVDRHDMACSWVEPDLCSSCADLDPGVVDPDHGPADSCIRCRRRLARKLVTS